MVRLSSAASITRYKVSGMDWNECPESNGIGVRIAPEWVSGLPRNTHKRDRLVVKDLTKT
jgi:hypothetical protein